jgi:hypothetical protein
VRDGYSHRLRPASGKRGTAWYTHPWGLATLPDFLAPAKSRSLSVAALLSRATPEYGCILRP